MKWAAMWAGAFLLLGMLSLYAIAYVGDRAVDPWPGYAR